MDAFNQTHAEKGKALLLDITDEQAIEKVVENINSGYGKIAVLVNNAAGIGFAGAVEETSIPEVRNVFEANFFGALKLTQCVLPMMRDAKKRHIVQVSSHGGIKVFAGFGIYNASKFALEGFT